MTERKPWEGRKTASLSLLNPASPHSVPSLRCHSPPFCSVVARPGIIIVCPERPNLECCPLRCSWEAEKEINLSVFLVCQNISRFHLFLGVAFLSSLHGHLLLQYGGFSGRNRVISLWSLFQPSPEGPSSVACFFNVSLLRNSGLSHNYDVDRPLA